MPEHSAPNPSAIPRTPPALVMQLRDVTHRFGQQLVLENISFDIREGETLALIGESGCGKSVTTKLLAGLLTPTSGTVYWGGMPCSEMPAARLREEQVKLGYLFQGAALFDSLSVYENVAFGLHEQRQSSAAEIDRIVFERLKEVGLPRDAAAKRPSELSGGMRKRVGLARALAISPRIMFYDEPTTGLDPVMSDVINELILQTQQTRGITSVVVTHDMTTVKRVADRAIMLQPAVRRLPGQSQILFDDAVAELFSFPDPRVSHFVHGEARDRIAEISAA